MQIFLIMGVLKPNKSSKNAYLVIIMELQMNTDNHEFGQLLVLNNNDK
jgi:hypothetical protein